MRIFFLALMIALLPLRGWVGDVMAVERLGPPPATQAAHTQAGSVGHAHAAADCAHLSSPSSAAHTDASLAEASAGDCAGCTTCQICHSVALGAVPSTAGTAVLPTLAPCASPSRYASAEPAPGFKPPIS